MAVAREAHPTVPPPKPEPFRCDLSYTDNAAEAKVRGEMRLANAPGLLRDLVAALERPVVAISLDLAQVTYVDSSGIATLVAAEYQAAQRGITFQLVGVSDQTRRIFEITDLPELFDLTD